MNEKRPTLNPPKFYFQELLEDDRIWKVGVGPENDVRQLRRGFGVQTRGRVDLRNIARQLGYTTPGLKQMAVEHIAVRPNWKTFKRADWSEQPMPPTLLNYAANDAIDAIEVFKKFMDDAMHKHQLSSYDDVMQLYGRFVDRNFRSNLRRDE